MRRCADLQGMGHGMGGEAVCRPGGRPGGFRGGCHRGRGVSAMQPGHDVHPEEPGHDGQEAHEQESAAKGGCGMAHESSGRGILPPDGSVGR